MLDQAQCGLFTLPAEIRVRIYEFVLAPKHGPVRLRHCRSLAKWNPPPRTVLTLLETCKRIRDEAEFIFYQHNRLEFDVTHQAGAPPIWETMGPARCMAICSLTLCVSSGPSALRAFEGLRPLRRLQELRVKRTTSIIYTNLQDWSSLSKQMLASLEGLDELRMLQMVVPESVTYYPPILSLAERQDARMQRLAEIDRFLEDGIDRRTQLVQERC